MSDYQETSPKEYLKRCDWSDQVISHPMAGDQYVASTSDAMKEYAKLCIQEFIETAKAHSDNPDDTDWDGAGINCYRQMGLL